MTAAAESCCTWHRPPVVGYIQLQVHSVTFGYNRIRSQSGTLSRLQYRADLLLRRSAATEIAICCHRDCDLLPPQVKSYSDYSAAYLALADAVEKRLETEQQRQAGGDCARRSAVATGSSIGDEVTRGAGGADGGTAVDRVGVAGAAPLSDAAFEAMCAMPRVDGELLRALSRPMGRVGILHWMLASLLHANPPKQASGTLHTPTVNTGQL